MAAAEGGAAWLEALEEAKEPWFHFSTGVGYNHADPVWIDDLRLPFIALRGYVKSLPSGRGHPPPAGAPARGAAPGDGGVSRPAAHRSGP